MYELYDPCTVMFFYRNKHMMIDLGTGNNNKINWAMEDPQEFIDIVEVRRLSIPALFQSHPCPLVPFSLSRSLTVVYGLVCP